jgi:hypothetical protein
MTAFKKLGKEVMKEKIVQQYMNMMGRERMPEVCKTVS